MDTLRGIVGLGNLALMLGTFGLLAWFAYWMFLRKFLRARRIANLRMSRMLRERQDGSDR